MRDDLGLHLELKANLISDAKGASGCVTFQFGVNKVPSRHDIDNALADAIDQFNKAAGTTDARLTTMRDFGFAESRSLSWPPVEEATQ